MRVFTNDHHIVRVKHLAFCYLSYALLLNIQQHAENMLIEIEGDTYPQNQTELHKFIPAHNLCLEDFRALSLLNA